MNKIAAKVAKRLQKQSSPPVVSLDGRARPYFSPSAVARLPETPDSSTSL